MSNIQIHTKCGDFSNLPDISYEKFVDIEPYKQDATDAEYYRYLSNNNMVELSDINPETIKELTIIYEDTNMDRVIHFKAIYDSDDDSEFNSEEYFG